MIPSLNRRSVMRLAGAAVLAAPFVARARAAAARVVVIGGGAGGATAARLLAASGAPLDVALVTADRRFTTCFFSNLYLAGARPLESLTHGYGRLEAQGIEVVHAVAAVIDAIGRNVRLANGGSLAYDRLIVAPGIGFRWDAIDGYGRGAAEIMPHAWKGGQQSALLRRRLAAMEDGGVFLIAPPQDPYRCTSAPYERVSLVAHYFARVKPRSKIVILDAKDSFPLQALFEEGWARYYDGMIEVIPAEFAGGAQAVDVHAGTVMSLEDTFRPAVANVIPPQMAGRLAQESGLADASGWCPVDPTTFESTRIPGIHVIGDAAIAAPMPKAGYVAAHQARIAAGAILQSLVGRPAIPVEVGGACWTHIAPDHAVSERASFAITDGRIALTALSISATGEPDEVRAAAAADAEGWYRDITVGMFG